MAKDIIGELLRATVHDLRMRKQETVYRTAKESGLRADVIRRLEADEPSGSAASLIQYLNSYCSRFPGSAYKILYSLTILVAQQQLPFDRKD